MNFKRNDKKLIKGLFGILYPADFRYKIKNAGELKTVKWLIREGVYKSVKEYEERTTKQLLGQQL